MEQPDDLMHLRRLWNFWPSRIILTANNFCLFDHLEEGKGVVELAELLTVSQRGLGILLNALCGLGLLEKRGDLYLNTPSAGKYLVSRNPGYQGDMIRHYDTLWQNWSSLDEIVRTGVPQRRASDHTSFIRAMHNNAVFKAVQVVDSLDLSGVKRALDLAGGPGTYSMELTRRGVEVTLFDLPDTIAIAREISAEQGITLSFREGDALADPVGEGYDLIFISHLLHSYSPDENRRILANSCKGLNPGGRIVVQEFLIEDSLTTPVMGALFAVNMLVHSEGGRCYPPSEIASWLRETGFARTEEIRLEETVLVIGR
jgi:2-polyprenyl-3-methyl-5-hydroxy-6-metoxy-1,4-benzoquinol methylase